MQSEVLKRAQQNFLELCENNGFIYTEVKDWGEFAFRTRFSETPYPPELQKLFNTLNTSINFPYRGAINGIATVGVLHEKANIDAYIRYIHPKGNLGRTLEADEIYLSEGKDLTAYIWVQENKPIIKHVVPTKFSNEFYLCINGIPVLLIAFTKNPTKYIIEAVEPAPAYSISTDGSDFYINDYDVLSSAYENINFNEFSSKLSDDNFLIQFCLGRLVDFGNFWISLDIDSATAYSYPEDTTAIEWVIQHIGHEILESVAVNYPLPEETVIRAIEQTKKHNVECHSSVTQALLSRDASSESFLKMIMEDPMFEKDKNSFLILLTHSNAPVKWLLENHKEFIEDGTLEPSTLERGLINHPYSVTEFLNQQFNFGIVTDVPKEMLVRYLMDCLFPVTNQG